MNPRSIDMFYILVIIALLLTVLYLRGNINASYNENDHAYRKRIAELNELYTNTQHEIDSMYLVDSLKTLKIDSLSLVASSIDSVITTIYHENTVVHTFINTADDDTIKRYWASELPRYINNHRAR